LEDLLPRLLPFAGIATMVGFCLLMSSDWKAALRRWPLVAWGFGLQFSFAVLILRWGPGKALFDILNDVFVAVINCTYAGAEFVFGPLATPFGDENVATVGYVKEAVAGNPQATNDGFIFAFYVLSTIIFFSALTSILYHLGILQKLVMGVAWVMQRTMKTSGAETLSASGNIFVGQTEAPLLVRPFIGKMTDSELMTVMTGGFATVAGSVMASYIGVLSGSIPGIAGHLLAASIMSAPAALLFGKLIVPETSRPETADTMDIRVEKESVNVIDAAAVGTTTGVKLALNVGGMLLAFLALIALMDLLLNGWARLVVWSFFGGDVAQEFAAEPPAWITLRGIVSYIFSPLAYLLGITDWQEARAVGELLGIKMVANEFVAYLDLSALSAAGELSERTRIIASYALCGFANFGSIGIQIGGLAVMAPERRPDLSRLGLRAMLAGTFAANATGCVAAILI